MSRAPSGTLIRNRNGWSAKFWATCDACNGEGGKCLECKGKGRKRYTRELGTDVKRSAEAKLRMIVESENPAAFTVGVGETFEQAAARVMQARRESGVHATADELTRLRTFAFPEFGDRPVKVITTAHVNASLDRVREAGKSRQTCVHVRAAIGLVFAALKREGVIKVNPADDATMPRFPTAVKKERAVLSDAELERYLQWEHPIPEHRIATIERQVMACVARTFGGLRTGDLHSLKWEAFDLPSLPGKYDGFTLGWAPRQKTRRPQRLAVPYVAQTALDAWWELNSAPRTGLVFPSRRGERAGEAKIKVSHARAFRRDLRRAFGLDEWDEVRGEFVKAREPTERERELLQPTAYTLPVDWHSWRRAYSQALADADVTAQQASALAGHASLSAHARYLASASTVRHLPEGAEPKLFVQKSAAETNQRSDESGVSVSVENRSGISGADGTRTRGLRRDRPAL
jgi:integrase